MESNLVKNIPNINKELISILITGSNRGIGLGIINSLIKNQINSNNFKYKIILTSRDEKKGLEAIENLRKNFGDFLIEKNLLIYKQLDINNEDSINKLIEDLKENKDPLNLGNSKGLSQIDILVNNAGIFNKEDKEKVNNLTLENYQSTFSTNFFNTVKLTEKFLDENLLKNKGKIIIIGSAFGNLKKLGKDLLTNFQEKNLKISDLFKLAEIFKDSMLKGDLIEKGWIDNIYQVSKMFVNKYAQILGNERNDVKDREIQVYSCCVGWVRTDMGGPEAYRSIEEGVICPVKLIELKHKIFEKYQGKFFKLVKGDIKVSNIGI